MARITLAFTLVALLGACAAETEPAGVEFPLTDKAAVEAEVFYIDTTISEAPLAADQLAGSTCATPVRIVFEEDLAVAYYAPEGEPILDEDHILSIWGIVEHAEPADGELDGGDSTLPPVEVPAPEYPTPELDHRLDMNPVSDIARALMKGGINAPYARIDWLRQYFEDMLRLPPGSHPGCD